MHRPLSQSPLLAHMQPGPLQPLSGPLVLSVAVASPAVSTPPPSVFCWSGSVAMAASELPSSPLSWPPISNQTPESESALAAWTAVALGEEEHAAAHKTAKTAHRWRGVCAGSAQASVWSLRAGMGHRQGLASKLLSSKTSKQGYVNTPKLNTQGAGN